MTDTGVSSAFEMQRGMIKQNQQALDQFVAVGRTATRAFTDSLETVRDVQQQNVDFTRDAVHAYLDALEEIAPDADVSAAREQVESNFDQFEDAQDETWETVFETVEHSRESFEEYGETYGDLVDSSFDSFLDAHEAVEAGLEDAESIEFDAN